ncbi:MAG: M23 family metallopeptidase [Chloroflexi bacterium]|nr:M23 family metallopeptidase [Chloroflexota bacterium]
MTRQTPTLSALAATLFCVCLLGLLRLSAVPMTAAASPGAAPTPTPEPTEIPDPAPAWPSDLTIIEPGYLLKSPLLHTEIPSRPRKDVFVYHVTSGDTIIGIAHNFGISPESILWANERVELNPDFLRVGQEVTIPPTTGVLHEVKAGDSIESLAKKYKVAATAITEFEYNALAPPYFLTAGQKVMVPGGEKPYQPRVVYGYSGPLPTTAKKGFGAFAWPISGVLTQGYWTGHRAIDVGAPTGTRVVAADSGFVVLVRYDNFGYGRHIMINHGNGFETLYAHLSVILVEPGQSVARGQLVGLSGNTGHSTGPHLHFEVRYLGNQNNPLAYLP